MSSWTPDAQDDVAQLRQSEERYRRLTEGLTDYVYTVRLENGLPVQTTHGPACLTVTGYQASEFAADPYLWIMMVVPEDRALVQSHVQQILAGQTPPPLEHRIVRKDGQVRWVRDVAVLNVGPTGELLSYDGLIKDITERKLGEERLRESEDVFKTLAEQCPISIMRFDRYGRVSFVNEWHMAKFARHRLEPSFFLGKTVFDLPGLVNAGVAEEVARMFNGETVEIDEVFFPEFAAGGSGWVSIRGVPIIRDGQVWGGILVREDLTQRKKVEEELRRKQEELQQSLDEKDTFFSIIAHDLKNPLSGFLGLTRMFVQEAHALSVNELQQAAGQMLQSAESMFALLDNLLQWAQSRRGQVRFEPCPCLLADLVLSSADALAAVADQKRIRVHLVISPHVRVHVDSHMTATVIRNLLSNALKFTPQGGEVTVTAERQDSMIVLAVRDTGIGMDSATLAMAFALDRKARREGTDGEKSTGLGLVLCQEFVARQGGRIWAESCPGQGSVFRFSMPVVS